MAFFQKKKKLVSKQNPNISVLPSFLPSKAIYEIQLEFTDSESSFLANKLLTRNPPNSLCSGHKHVSLGRQYNVLCHDFLLALEVIQPFWGVAGNEATSILYQLFVSWAVSEPKIQSPLGCQLQTQPHFWIRAAWAGLQGKCSRGSGSGRFIFCRLALWGPGSLRCALQKGDVAQT